MQSRMNGVFTAAAITGVLLLVAATGIAVAKGGDNDAQRAELRGVIEAMPQHGLQGEWVIGGRTFVTGPGTEFDQSEGELRVGGCAKVDVRDGRVHEIDSEPPGDCH